MSDKISVAIEDYTVTPPLLATRQERGKGFVWGSNLCRAAVLSVTNQYRQCSHFCRIILKKVNEITTRLGNHIIKKD